MKPSCAASLHPLILASASPQRRSLLRSLVETFDCVAPAVDETPPPLPLPDAVRAIARRKAEQVAARFVRATVLAADTVIDLDGELLGKPADAADARRMLERLSGRAHAVHTGVALLHRPSGIALDGVETTAVEFRPISADEIERSIASGEPFGKAGAYAIQGGARAFVQRLRGDLDNVVGLPLRRVGRMLEQLAAAVERAAP